MPILFLHVSKQGGNETANEEPEGSGPFLAFWQFSPTIPLPALLNFNFFAFLDLAPMLHEAVETGKAVLGFLQTEHAGSDTEDLIRVFLTLGQYRHSGVAYDADPMTQVTYPVFDNFGPDREVTGVCFESSFVFVSIRLEVSMCLTVYTFLSFCRSF
jgi:hypothetical protein